MPSVLLGLPFTSGDSSPQPLISGFPWSGNANYPYGSIRLRLSSTASGNVYVGLSGAMTLNSGGPFLSGGGLVDGMEMAPGDVYDIPRLGTGASGEISVFVRHDAAVSGQGRMYYEIF